MSEYMTESEADRIRVSGILKFVFVIQRLDAEYLING